MYNKIKNEHGSAILVAMMLLLMMTVVSFSMFSVSSDDVSISSNSNNMTKAFYSSEAGLALAKSMLWSDYVEWGSTNPQKIAGQTGNRATYQKYLDNLGLTDNTTSTLYSSFDLGGGQSVEKVSVTRTDVTGTTLLSVSSTGSALDGSQNTISAQLRVEGEAFKGFEFAILANNINCIMCHARIDNVDRVYNTDPTKEGTYDRVKVASLESMLIRDTKADSYVAGTIYTRGNVTDKAGNLITNLSPTGAGVEGYAINASDGKIQEPLTSVNLSVATGSPLPQNGNLYLNYPTEQGNMTDGILPTEFPPPFPDGNGNKIVDDAEFDEIAIGANGGISGGIIYGVQSNQTYNSGALPSSGNETSVNGTYSGNLILVGTDANPIDLSGDIAVDGDVVIQGKVIGTGQIYARGNVYITGDLTYADGTNNGNRTFGTSANGRQNALSIAAGKNVMVGDYLTPKKGDHTNISDNDPGNLSGGEMFSFTQSEMTLFNRSEWTKTQEFLPDANGGLVPNGTYDPSYQPRYYVMNEGDPVYIFNKNYTDKKGKAKGTYWDPSSNSWQVKEHASSYDLSVLTKLNAGTPALSGASISTLSTTSNWISPQNLKSMWVANDAARPSGQEFKIDGQIYTSNSIFALTRKASNTLGKMTINGSIVAADVGVLVGGGLNLHYDQRLKTFLNIKDDSKVLLVQTSWYSE